MKYKITTMLRSGIKDNAGTAVTNTLNRINFDTVTAVRIGKVFYIDTTDDINDMINNYGKWKEWKSCLEKGEIICINYTLVNSTYNERVEAALIYFNKPPINVEYKNTFPFNKTTVKCTGDYLYIASNNIVEKTNG
jgi:hypothetical protein